ncbi:hypothetical protein JCM5353_007538 [Sporobolomyces roseus]
MGNQSSVPLDPLPTSHHIRSQSKKASISSLPLSAQPAPPAWRRASEPSVLPRRKSLLRKNTRRRSDEERLKAQSTLEGNVPRLVIGEGGGGARTIEDEGEGLLIRIGGRKFSRAEPVDTEDALEALERITRAASFSATTTREMESNMTPLAKKKPSAEAPRFSFDVNYRLDSPRQPFVSSPALQPIPSVPQQQIELSPFDSPASRNPLSPTSHWSESSACGETPPPTFNSFRNSVNVSKTLHRYSNLFASSGDSSSSPNDSIIDLSIPQHTTRSKLGNILKGHRGGKKSKSRDLGKIVVVKAERLGSARYSELREAADQAAATRSNSASSGFPSSPSADEGASFASASSQLDRASWIQLDIAPASTAPSSPSARRHSSPDPQLAHLVAASPKLAFAGPEEDIFVPFDSEPSSSLFANPSPVKSSNRLPIGHPAANHHNRFAPQPAPLSAIPRPRLAEFGRTSSFTSAHRSSAYTTASRQSIVSEVESNSSALQATVHQGFRTSRAGSMSVPLAESAPPEPLPLPANVIPTQGYEFPPSPIRRFSVASIVERRPSCVSTASFPRSDSVECPRTVVGRQLSITSTFYSQPNSPEESTPPLPTSRPDFSFGNYSLSGKAPSRRSSRVDVSPETTSKRTSPSLNRQHRPPSLDLTLRETRPSTPSSLPPLTSTTSTSFSSRSSVDPSHSLQVPTRPFGRLSLEQPDAALLSLSTPFPPSKPHESINFGNFSLDYRPTLPLPPSSSHNLSPTTPYDEEIHFAFPPKPDSPKPPTPFASLNEFNWNRASAADALHGSSPTVVQLEDRRETYPRSNSHSHSTNKRQNVFDALVQQAMNRVEPRKRGMSKEEVEIWLGS